MTTAIFLITLFLLVWFKTDAFIIYSKLFKLNKLFYINEWKEFKNTKDISVTYHQFLKIKNPDSFFIKLITCPICFAIWLSFPAIYFNIYTYPFVCVMSLIIYYGTVKLME